MRAQDVPANHGWLWIKQGFALFRKAPLMWWVILGLWFLTYRILKAFFGPSGEVAFALFYPTLSAGLMLGCRALETGEELEAAHLVAGFKNNFRQLLLLGSMTLVAGLLIGWLASLIVPADPETLKLLATPGADLRPALPWLLTLLAVQMTASIPVLMAVWFAPPLLVFHRMSAIDAIRWSFYACIANIGAFTIYGVVSLGLTVLASLPLGLGLIVMIPTLVASTYSSYRDIFTETPAAPAEAAA
ncbi:MAG: hypothetical protein H0U63_06000 [Burkholderiales bacterium]|nr:hypothetical protein [Burkholderiales bacterium]